MRRLPVDREREVIQIGKRRVCSVMGPETGGLTRADVEALYGSGRAGLFRLVSLVTRDAHLAEEVVQEAYARLWTKPSRVRDPSRVDAYVRTIARNLVRSRFSTAARRRSIGDRFAGDPTGPSRLPEPDPMRGADDRELLRAGLNDLTVNQRTCVVCRYWLGLTDEEIAQVITPVAGPDGTIVWRLIEPNGRPSQRATVAGLSIVRTSLADAALTTRYLGDVNMEASSALHYLAALPQPSLPTPVWVVAIDLTGHVPQPTCASGTVDTCPDVPELGIAFIDAEGRRDRAPVPVDVSALRSQVKLNLAVLGPVGHWTPTPP